MVFSITYTIRNGLNGQSVTSINCRYDTIRQKKHTK